MASQTFSSIIPKCAQFGSVVARRSTSIIEPFHAGTRHIQTGSGSHSQQDASSIAKRGLNEALKTGENLMNKAASTTEDMAENTKEKAENVAQKAKETTQGAWETAKGAAQNTKDNTFNKVDEAKETVKEKVDRSMNTKNNPNC